MWATQAFGQSLSNAPLSSIFNSQLASGLARASTVPVSISQSISQIADGVGWKTTIILANTDTVPANFTLNFWKADGTPLSLPLIGQGSQQQVTGQIPVNGAMTLETPGGAAGTFSQGWGQLTTSNSIGGATIFRASVPGRPDFEASVPVLTPVGQRLILPYDNSNGFATAVALVNPDPNNAAVITANAYDEGGNLLGSSVIINLPPNGQLAFALTDKFAASAGHRGAANFSSSGALLTGLGLRFSPAGPFTSIEMLTPPSQ